MKFKIGDKVRLKKGVRLSAVSDGMALTGTMGVKLSIGCRVTGVTRFSVFVSGCPFAIPIERVELVSPDQKIVITMDGKDTLARLYENGKVVKRAVARCSDEDTFDFQYGSQLAFERLMEKETKEEPKTEDRYDFTGFLMCIAKLGEKGYTFTKNKIYPCVLGKVVDDNGIPTQLMVGFPGSNTGYVFTEVKM